MRLIKENKYLIFGIIVLLILLWWTRYQFVGTSNYAYRLDRLSGKIETIGGRVNLGDVITLKEWNRLELESQPAPEPAPLPLLILSGNNAEGLIVKR